PTATAKDRGEDAVNIPDFVYLTDITLGEGRQEAFLRNRLTNREMRLRMSAGFNTFRITDEAGERTLVRAELVRIDTRDIYFRANGSVYALHVGQNLADAMRRPLPESEVQSLQLAQAVAP